MKTHTIIDYTDYTISENGVVQKSNGHIMKQRIKKNGYCEVAFSNGVKRKFFLVHRLVAEYFVPNPENKPQVNHINGIKTDNCIGNLEWVTSKQNHKHAKEMGLGHYSDERNGFSKKVINVKTGEEFGTAKLAYKSYNPEYGYVYFTRKLSGEKRNYTPFRYR